MASESLSVVARFLNRPRWRLAQWNRARTNKCLALPRQKQQSYVPTGTCELLLSFIRWASTHDALHAHHVEEKWLTKKIVGEPLAPVSRAIWGRHRGGTYGIHFLRPSSCSAHICSRSGVGGGPKTPTIGDNDPPPPPPGRLGGPPGGRGRGGRGEAPCPPPVGRSREGGQLVIPQAPPPMPRPVF